MDTPVSKILHFDAGERLTCPNCSLTSSNHKYHSPGIEYYWDKKVGPHHVCLHTCKSCGYTDDTGSGFTDCGNDSDDKIMSINGWEEELRILEDDVADLKAKIAEGKEIYRRRWLSTEDTTN